MGQSEPAKQLGPDRQVKAGKALWASQARWASQAIWTNGLTNGWTDRLDGRNSDLDVLVMKYIVFKIF